MNCQVDTRAGNGSWEGNIVEKRSGNQTIDLSIMISVIICLAGTLTFAEDWPTRLHDIRRGGITTEQLYVPLLQAWVYETDNAPEPAWTESPALSDYYNNFKDLKPRQSFDYSFDVAVANGFVYFGSSITCEVTCLDMTTGQTVWTFFTEGPVRFAPTVAADKVYFGSDDGYVYCLNADDGSEVWKQRAGGEDMIWGNEHMISVWPVRCSVLVDGNDVFWTAGLFPEEDMYFCKRHADDGTGGWVVTPELPPQGYLLATDDLIFVPSGKTYPTAYNRSTGSFVGHINRSTRDGGAWALVSPDQKDIWVGPGINNAPQKFSTATRAYAASISDGNYLIVDMMYSYFNNDTSIMKVNRADRSLVWAVDEKYPYSIIKGGSTLYAGGDGCVAAFASENGHKLWHAEVKGKVYGLAVADDSLFVSTDKGSIYCFSAFMPAISADAGAAVQDRHRVTLNGDLFSEGAGQTTVSLYWGATDGKMEPQQWDNAVDLGMKTCGQISQTVAGLQSDSLYYYRYCAANRYGTAWASQSEVFITGQISLETTVASATESGSGSGRFLLKRPTWSISEEMTVSYSVSGTANPVDDYEALGGKVVFGRGFESAVIDVIPVDDLRFEEVETVDVALAQGAYLLASEQSATVTIADNDDLKGYRYRMKIQFGGYRGAETLVNFPVLIVVNDAIEGFAYDQMIYGNGSDLRFVAADEQTYLKYEFEQWDINGDSKIWVNVPEIASRETYVWLYWSNAESHQHPLCTSDGSVWSDEFANVWHMNNDAGVLNDATATDNNGTVSGDPVDIEGIGSAIQFDGAGDYFSLSDPLSIGSTSNTVSAWIKVPSAGSAELGSTERIGVVLGNYNGLPNSNWELTDAGLMRIYWNNGNPNGYGTTDLRDNDWHHLAWVRDKQSNAFYMYIDGQLTQTSSGAGSDITLNSAPKIAADNRGSSTPCFHGSIDELRVSSVARSADWLKAHTDNLMNHSSFISYGDGTSYHQNMHRQGDK
jgi:outer membrane protein assembly factor BamB